MKNQKFNFRSYRYNWLVTCINYTAIFILSSKVLSYILIYIRVCLNYQLYQICVEDSKLPDAEDFRQDNKQKFIWMFKIQNLFYCVVKISQQIKIAIQEFDKEHVQIIKDLALQIYHDMIAYFDVISKEISIMEPNYTLYATVDVMSFYEIYNSLINMSQSLQDFSSLKNIIDPFNSLKEPFWLTFTSEQHQDIENYYKKIKLLNQGSLQIKQNLKKMIQSNTQISQQYNQNNQNPYNNYQGPAVIPKPLTPPGESKQNDSNINKRSHSFMQSQKEVIRNVFTEVNEQQYTEPIEIPDNSTQNETKLEVQKSYSNKLLQRHKKIINQIQEEQKIDQIENNKNEQQQIQIQNEQQEEVIQQKNNQYKFINDQKQVDKEFSFEIQQQTE